MTKWVDDLKEKYEGKVNYAVGFNPPPPAEPTTTVTEGETTG